MDPVNIALFLYLAMANVFGATKSKYIEEHSTHCMYRGHMYVAHHTEQWTHTALRQHMYAD